MRGLKQKHRDYLVRRFDGWVHSNVKHRTDTEPLVLGEGGRTSVERIFEHFERFLGAPLPEEVREAGEAERFDRLFNDTLGAISSLLGLKRHEHNERERRTRELIFQVEPFVFKILALLERETFFKFAETNKTLYNAFEKLIAEDRIPYDGLSSEEFKAKEGWETRTSYANALRDVYYIRNVIAHQANSVVGPDQFGGQRIDSAADFADKLDEIQKIDRRHEPLWESALAVMLGLVSTNMDQLAAICSDVELESLEDSDPRAGQLIDGDKYRTLEPLGEGGTGKVFRGIDLDNDIQVAIKFLHGSERDDETQRARDRFQREKEHLSALNQHDHVTDLEHFGTDPRWGDYLVMEYVQGVDLAQLLERGRLRFDVALKITRQICSALVCAHGEDIVHRDLKPQNLRLEPKPSDDKLVVKVLDLGIAVEPDRNTRFTQTGQIVGTPLYRSPEHLQTGAETRSESDLYSLGIVLFEMLTGEPPYGPPVERRQKMQAMAAIEEAPRKHKDPEVRPPEISEKLMDEHGLVGRLDDPDRIDDLIQQLMATRPSARPDSAESVKRTIGYMLIDLQLDHFGQLKLPELPDSACSDEEALVELLAEEGLLVEDEEGEREPLPSADSLDKPLLYGPVPEVTSELAERALDRSHFLILLLPEEDVDAFVDEPEQFEVFRWRFRRIKRDTMSRCEGPSSREQRLFEQVLDDERWAELRRGAESEEAYRETIEEGLCERLIEERRNRLQSYILDRSSRNRLRLHDQSEIKRRGHELGFSTEEVEDIQAEVIETHDIKLDLPNPLARIIHEREGL